MLGFIHLEIADKGDVGYDGFKEIEGKDWGDNFSFGLPLMILAKEYTITEKPFHIGDIDLSFGKEEDFFNRQELPDHIWINKVYCDVIDNIMNCKIIGLSFVLIIVVAVFVFGIALVEALDVGDSEGFEGEGEDFVAEGL